MGEYNIIWIDDQVDELISIEEDFMEGGLTVLGKFTNREEAVAFLEKDQAMVDAIVTDALFFDSRQDKNLNSTSDRTALTNFIFDYSEKFKNDIPLFILSGQAQLFQTENELVAIQRTKHEFQSKEIYDKLSDLDTLIKDIKRATESKPQFKVRQEKVEFIEIIDKHFEKSSVALDFINLVLSKEEQNFNSIRIFLEKIIKLLIIKKHLPGDMRRKDGSVNLGYSVQLLATGQAGKDREYEIEKSYVWPSPMGFALSSLKEAGNLYSHDNLVSSNLISTRSSKSLFKSSLYSLETIIYFLDDYLTKFPEGNSAKNNTQASKEVYRAQKDKEDNWNCGDGILLDSGYCEKIKLKEGERIIIQLTSKNTRGGLSEKYPFFGSRFKKYSK